VRGVVGVDEFGFILTDTEVARRPELLPEDWPEERAPYLSETSVPGVFAAGDVRAGSIKRIGSAVGQGAVAMAAVAQYLHGLDGAAPRLPGGFDEGRMLEAPAKRAKRKPAAPGKKTAVLQEARPELPAPESAEPPEDFPGDLMHDVPQDLPLDFDLPQDLAQEG
jgi:hypothetical protein